MACSIPCRSRFRSCGQVLHGILRADGDHAATDVHAHGRRDDGAQRGDDGSHGGAQAQMGVRHQRQMRIDDGQLGGGQGLLAGLVIKDRRPADEPAVDDFHGASQNDDRGPGGRVARTA